MLSVLTDSQFAIQVASVWRPPVELIFQLGIILLSLWRTPEIIRLFSTRSIKVRQCGLRLKRSVKWPRMLKTTRRHPMGYFVFYHRKYRDWHKHMSFQRKILTVRNPLVFCSSSLAAESSISGRIFFPIVKFDNVKSRYTSDIGISTICSNRVSKPNSLGHEISKMKWQAGYFVELSCFEVFRWEVICSLDIFSANWLVNIPLVTRSVLFGLLDVCRVSFTHTFTPLLNTANRSIVKPRLFAILCVLKLG